MSKCSVCSKSVYPMDPQINLDGLRFHKPCAKCADCSCQITISNFTKGEQDGQLILLCKTHYFKRFKEGGSYVGGERFQVKSTRDLQASSRRSSLAEPSPTTASTATPVTSSSAASPVDVAVTNGSVRDRIASIKSNEKPKTDVQTTSRRSSFDQTKSKSNDGAVKHHEPVLTPEVAQAASLPTSPEKVAPSVSVSPASPVPEVLPPVAPVEVAAPAPATVESSPAPIEAAAVEAAPVEAAAVEAAPVETAPVETAPVETAAVEAVPAAVADEPTSEETTQEEPAPAVVPSSPVDESVIDASPENGVSTPHPSSFAVETSA